MARCWRRRSRGQCDCVLILAVFVAEEVALVPRRPLLFFGDEIAGQKSKSRVLRSGLEVQSRLLHIVLGLVVAGLVPISENIYWIYLWIAGFEADARHHRGNPLFYEGILIAAD